MRIQKPKRRDALINVRTMYYALYGKKTSIDGEFETSTGYFEPVKFNACLSTGQSNAEESPFGVNVSYDRVISTVQELPIDENSIIWINAEPKYLEDGTVDGSSADYKVAAPPLDGLNSLRIAVKKVSNNSLYNKEETQPETDKKDSTDTDEGF